MSDRPPCWHDGSCPTPIRCYLRGCQRESNGDNEQSEPAPTLAELISFLRACEDQIGTENYSRPRFRAVLAIVEAYAWACARRSGTQIED
jgi:hypothetical protein